MHKQNRMIYREAEQYQVPLRPHSAEEVSLGICRCMGHLGFCQWCTTTMTAA